MKKILFVVGALVLSMAASAVEKRYVTDTLFLQLRTGPSQEHRILRALPSGEHLVVLEESDPETGYTKVRSPQGQEGYVLTRFLVDEPVAKEKLILTTRELEKIKAELATSQQQRNEYRQELEQIKSERATLSRSSSELEKELERITSISANALSLDERNRTLTQRNQELEIQLEAINAENEQLRYDSRNTYLLYGGGLVALGIFAGLVLPSLRGKRSSGWA
ncbi:MAG: TIGR04211 family SH3 domain-containing protein [Bacterioplanes sp.]|nr:TIGR04211 family SH3 domain-containing protein [Bacterioplanes sp.]